ncbi:NADP-dependent malic enzyme [Methylibium sp. Root1272]|uniref:NADP-dependent malic enzyme n=1 Tax=Methylibium sp. Root1272 TaxID=1736441 RepID=UPI00070003DB|nr:NADP-dependent malic enzyme [Methylibium sp. Root1272]KQW69897.1 malic enzyme [Methylibium sp. Root1272]
MSETLKDSALDYHRFPTPGKIAVMPTKAMATQRDLALAYSPGVAEACLAIVDDPFEASSLTARSNLVAVVTNGTAVLGLGDIGPLASKPVMEGKGCLFKKFAGIDVFDIELDEKDPDRLVETIARMEPTFGGINLEDIKAPECFYIERQLRERMKIPVFHDDQHGTAIVAAATVLNALQLVDKPLANVKVACSGAGAAAIACLDLLVSLGVERRNVFIADSKGVVHAGRTGLDASKARYAQVTALRTLADICAGADVFLGLSTGGVLKRELVASMARQPIILAMANPVPEILPEEALAARPDAIVGTGRSDYPNQVNNVLCFPFIFRGALDSGATTINEAMKLAAVRAIAELAHAEVPETVARAYGSSVLRFGPQYLIPKPFDPRLIEVVASAVAEAAAASGVASRPIVDIEAYRRRLRQFVYRSGNAMQPVFAAARAGGSLKRVAYAEGEDERVLRAAQVVVDEALVRPVLIGRQAVIAERIDQLGLRLVFGADYDVIDPNHAGLDGELIQRYYELVRHRGVTPALAFADVSTQPSLLASLLLRQGQIDAMLCGVHGRYHQHLSHVREAIGLRVGCSSFAAMQMLMLADRQLFICDTHVHQDPDAQQLAEITLLAAQAVRGFGQVPRVALLSHSSFGSSEAPSALKMRRALELIRARDGSLEIEGEMRGDAALSGEVLEREFPGAALHGEANLLVMPNVDAANISYNLLRMASGGGITVGGILLGAAKAAHILTPSSTVRRIVNMTAVAAADATALREQPGGA